MCYLFAVTLYHYYICVVTCVYVFIQSIIPSFPTFQGNVTCIDTPCQNGGTCSDKADAGVVCACAVGFGGVRCKNMLFSTYIMPRNTYNNERTIYEA